jgi:hypothetical protein
MNSSVQQDDAEFRPTLSGNLPNTTFARDSPAFNVEAQVQADLDKYLASQDGTSCCYIYYKAAQVIRVILKNWRMYPGLGKEYRPYPDDPTIVDIVDKCDYVSTAMYSIKEHRQSYESLEYKIAQCFTAEIRKYGNEQFTTVMLQGIIDGASKAYLKIMRIADVMIQDDCVRGLDPDPIPSTATYVFYPAYPEDVPSKKRKKPSPAIDGDQEKVEDAPTPTKMAKKMKAAGAEVPGATFIDKSLAWTPTWNAVNRPIRATGAEAAGTTFVDETPTWTAVNTNVNLEKRQGKHGHAPGLKWTNEEEIWIRQHVRANMGLCWQEHTDHFNDQFVGTRFDAGRKGWIMRRARTMQAVRKRFQGFKHAWKEGREPTGAAQGAEGDVDSEEDDMEVRRPFPRDLTQASSWSASIPSRASLTATRTDEMEVAGYDVNDGDEDINDLIGDLDKLSRRIEEGETFNDE